MSATIRQRDKAGLEAPRFLLGRLVFVAVLCAIVITAGGGAAFIRRPVGAVYLALWVVWWLATVVGRQRGASSAYDRKQRVIVVLTAVAVLPALVAAPPWEYAHFNGPIPRDGPLAWAGLVLFAAGITLQSAAMWALRGFFTVRLGVQPEQRLVTSGPYRCVRHPAYLSYLLSMTGIGLALSSLVGLGLAVMIVPFFLWRISGEEKMLVAEFGDAYRAYQRQARRLIPLVY